ncbi:hypothetical protein GOOTI_025_00040 [Gordonia otitidis NBRC 100426]|uniref:Helix-turn-helix domain-containing protein n=1 Tax=Gordonia otitidis (strain DSM 44809 / CCUG 52243 / JCM 12355 / NBRC 100426 / IFM 10032) TaxID=1108044 RepID=H5TGW6_GORO1|nr:hypothetical protein GOOTI_025_00040 [Gordonia otitidis NBRC 100426]
MAETPSVFLPVRELQTVIGCSRTAAIRLIETGEVEGKRIGARYYVKRSALELLTS